MSHSLSFGVRECAVIAICVRRSGVNPFGMTLLKTGVNCFM